MELHQLQIKLQLDLHTIEFSLSIISHSAIPVIVKFLGKMQPWSFYSYS